MINPAVPHNISDYIEILKRRLWFIIIPFVIIVLATIFYVVFAPRIYMASTMILVSPQKVPESYIHPTVTTSVAERLQSIAQEVMSRTRLEQVIAELNLYKKESKKLTKEELVELMRKDIRVELPRGKEGYFAISYMTADRRMAATVANRLASLFIEENLKVREQQAMGTTEFLATELSNTRAKLDEMDKQILEYKKQYMGELPEQRDTNLKIFEQYQAQSLKAAESMRAAQDRKIYLQKQLADLETSGTLSSTTENTKSGRGAMGSYESEIATLKNNLEALRGRYTDNHPDVLVTKRKIADLESKRTVLTIKNDPRYREIQGQLAATDQEIRRLRQEEALYQGQMSKYRARVENAPLREQSMATLMREYQNTKLAYDVLLQKSQGAQQAENLERRQKGEQFKVIDPARIPEKPFSPNIPKILLIGFMAAVGGGIGLALLREQMDRSFHDAEDVEMTLGLKVLANIPKIESKVA
jgi:polysaccharide chain length determinant protein (PEP-CTERM system associated)